MYGPAESEPRGGRRLMSQLGGQSPSFLEVYADTLRAGRGLRTLARPSALPSPLSHPEPPLQTCPGTVFGPMPGRPRPHRADT